MIVVRAPLRMSFVGGGTDIADFYRRSPGQVISATIDKYVYLAVNRTPFIDKVSARYSLSETVSHPDELQHTRIRAALKDMGIIKNIEIGSFASLPAKTGLGSSSSFSVALVKGLYAFAGKKGDAREIAEAASRLEIELVGEPIGKQDQYAASFGGFNVFRFRENGAVDVEPVLLDYRPRLRLEDHTLVFFTGLTRTASSVLTEQKANIDARFTTLQKMAAQVPAFTDALMKGDVKTMGAMLHEGWEMKRTLAQGISSSPIDALYDAGIKNGAWGGKVIGAGGGGCVMFIAPPEAHEIIRRAVGEVAHKEGLHECREIPVRFVQSGAQVLFNADHVNFV